MPAFNPPTRGPISSGFGIRRLPGEPPTFHDGLDFVGAYGSPIRAVKGGTVVVAAPNGTLNRYGNVVVIKHDNPYPAPYSLYAHLSAMRVRKGQHVTAGQLIGAMGNLAATAAEPWKMVRTHLHFEFLTAWPLPPDVGRIDPTPYFVDKPVTPVLSTPALYPTYAQGPLLYSAATPLTGLEASDSLNPALLYIAAGFGLGWLMTRQSAQRAYA